MARRRKPKTKEARSSSTTGVITLPGDRRAEIVREADPDGRPVTHHRTVDTLGRMLRAGTITPPMHDAARDFQARFTIAALDNIRTTSLVRISGGGHAADLTDRQVAARQNVHRVMAALGGINSPAGSCVWYVVGLQYSVREWAMRQGWGGRPVHGSQAQGILVAGLGLLAVHYGHESSHRIR
jgi:hypothetical protein